MSTPSSTFWPTRGLLRIMLFKTFRIPIALQSLNWSTCIYATVYILDVSSTFTIALLHTADSIWTPSIWSHTRGNEDSGWKGHVTDVNTNFVLHTTPPQDTSCIYVYVNVHVHVRVCICVCMYSNYRWKVLRVWMRGSYLTCRLENGTNLCRLIQSFNANGSKTKIKKKHKSLFVQNPTTAHKFQFSLTVHWSLSQLNPVCANPFVNVV